MTDRPRRREYTWRAVRKAYYGRNGVGVPHSVTEGELLGILKTVSQEIIASFSLLGWFSGFRFLVFRSLGKSGCGSFWEDRRSDG